MIWALYPNRKDDVKRKTTQFDIFIKNFFYKTRSVDYACETSNCHTFCPTIHSQNLPHLLSISKTENNKNCPRERLATCGANFSFATTCSLTVYFAIACFFHSVFCRQYVLPTVCSADSIFDDTIFNPRHILSCAIFLCKRKQRAAKRIAKYERFATPHICEHFVTTERMCVESEKSALQAVFEKSTIPQKIFQTKCLTTFLLKIILLSLIIKGKR